MTCVPDNVCSYCSFHGTCKMNKTDCYCQCDYKQKSRITALLLEVFFGLEFGAGYLYLELYDRAYQQMFLFSGMILACFIFFIFVSKGKPDSVGMCISSVAFMYILIVIINWIQGCSNIRSYLTMDGNGFLIST